MLLPRDMRHNVCKSPHFKLSKERIHLKYKNNSVSVYVNVIYIYMSIIMMFIFKDNSLIRKCSSVLKVSNEITFMI